MILLVDLNKYFYQAMEEDKLPSTRKILSGLYKDLSFIDEGSKIKISKILLLNVFIKNFQITKSDLHQNSKKRQNCSSTLSHLLAEAEIVNIVSFFIPNDIPPNFEPDFYPEMVFPELSAILYRVIKTSVDERIVFFDILLTPFIAYLLLPTVKLGGYKISKVKKKYEILEIDRPQKYIWIVCLLSSLVDDYEINTKIQFSAKLNLLLSAIKDFQTNHNTKCFIADISEASNSILDAFIDSLDERYVGLKRFNFDYEKILPKSFNKILIFNLEKQDPIKVREVINILNSKSNEYDLCMILSKDAIDTTEYPKIKILPLYSDSVDEAVLDEFINIFETNKKLFAQVYEQLLSILRNLSSDKTQYLQLENKLKSLSKLEFINILGNVEFWYNLDFFKPEQIKYTERLLDLIRTKLEVKQKKVYKLLHENDQWIIKIDGTEVKRIAYKRSKAIKYIVYLASYYSTDRISASDLRDVVDNWHKSKPKIKSDQTDASKISKDLSYFYNKQCPELKPLQEFIKISEIESNCYYSPSQNIVIEIDDDELPPMN